MTAPPDRAARDRAAGELDRNQVVVAAAGTGKTSLLVERLLVAVGSGRVTVDRLVAITFTEQAAGELRQRLSLGLDRLRGLAAGRVELDERGAADRAFARLERLGIDGATLAERAGAAVDGLDAARVDTIHGFCASILKEHPFEAGVEPDFSVDGGEVFQQLFEQRWERFVADEFGPQGSGRAIWAEMQEADIPLGDVRELAGRLAGFRIGADLLEQPGAATSADVDEAIGLLLERLDAAERDPAMTPKPRQSAAMIRRALEAARQGGPGAFKSFDEDHGVVENHAKSTGKSRIFKEAARDFKLLGKTLCAVDDELVGRIVGLLRPFVLATREALLRQGFVTFDGLLALTRDLLRDHIEVRERWKRRLAAIYVDEFQDTDPLQYEIVLYLAEADGSRAHRAFEAELAPGKLFIVGDPKQSIYRFRGADYAAFRQAVGRVLDAGGVRLDLDANFRSVGRLGEPVNELFDDRARSTWRASRYQPDFQPMRPVRKAGDDGPRLEVWTVDTGERNLAKERRENEGKVVAHAIDRWVRREKRYAFREVMILLRAFTQLADYLRPLREIGIPFVVDGGREFVKRPEVTQLLVLLKSLARPGDPVAWLGVLRSSVGGVPDTELADYAAASGRWSWWETVDAERFPDIAGCAALMRRLAAVTRDVAVDEAVRLVAEESGLMTLSAAAYEGPQRVANLEKLVASAGELARTGRLGLLDVVDAIEQERTTELQADSPLADEETDAVRIMTIHKAKGLEREVVIIPDLAREPFSYRSVPTAADPVTLADGRSALALSIGGKTNLARVRYVWEESRHEEAEETRVLYVGTTRARERLILLAAPARRRSPWVEALEAWGYDVDEPPEDGALLAGGRVLHRLHPDASLDRLQALERPALETDAVAAFEAARRLCLDAPSGRLAAPSGEETFEAIRGAAPAGRREVAERVGRLVHRALEGWDGKSDEALVERARRLAGEDEKAAEVVTLTEAFVASALRERLGAVKVLGRELPLLLRGDDGRTWRGSIDLLYRDEGGDFVVADYKTDRESRDGELQRRYGGQLAVYAEAVRQTLGLLLPPRTEVWHLRSGRIVRCDGQESGA